MMKKNKNEYEILNIDKNEIKEYEEEIIHNVVRGLLWTLLASSGVIGLSIAGSHNESLSKLIIYGMLTSCLYIPAVMSFNNAFKIESEMNEHISREIKRKQ